MNNTTPKIPEGTQRIYGRDTCLRKLGCDILYWNVKIGWVAFPSTGGHTFWGLGIPVLTLESSAVETLTRLGYTWEGGELWKPPIGKKPVFMEDLTTITEPFGELSRDIQLELVKHLLDGGELNRVYLDGEVYGSLKLEDKLSLGWDEGYSIKKKKSERELLEESLTSKLKEVEVLVERLKINS
jgi:hypothetical protein